MNTSVSTPISRVSRAEKFLENLSNQKLLSDKGREYVIAAVDPFHDRPLDNLCGFPDQITAPSIVRCVKQTASVSATSAGGSAPAGAWSLHVCAFPWENQITFVPTQNGGRKGNVVNLNVASPSNGLGGVCAMRSDNGTNDWMAAGTASNFLASIVPDPNGTGLLDSPYRIIGYGFEIHDTTAEINKQGSCMVWKAPFVPRDPCTWFAINTPISAQYTFTTMSASVGYAPPISTAQASQYPGSQVWEAKEGVYMVLDQTSMSNPPYNSDYTAPAFFNANADEPLQQSIASAVNTTGLYFPTVGDGSISTTLTMAGATAPNNVFVFNASSPQNFHLNPYRMGGAILSGLNPAATFQITVKWYIETFPTLADTKSLLSAKPSSFYDPYALEIVSRAFMEMPIGVPVRFNNLGDWFFDAISQAGKFLGPLVGMIPHPIAKAIAPVLTVAASAADSARSKPAQTGQQVVVVEKRKRKKLSEKNKALNEGNRGKKGNIQGPLLEKYR